MTQSKKKSSEASALERVADAAREVQAASLALEVHFVEGASHSPTTLELARFAAAIEELKDAREAFDSLLREQNPARAG
ncbi:hypothetical protein BGLT_06043 [Caballeronia glathei]|jgi:hypothetical protein|uniref:Uncharacterized protein n=1 Tax=Caballeronia glathei TaxID=60547 RepID=A0A069PMV5_9BURK|nr:MULTISPECIES: hypothetical protein [Burkholderiaceae]KDR41945.1 hypothetical protein BG61_14620 [Caballeronia glathei]TCK36666.1 hypothetical protein B0G84_5679 [Paraburkholderia sp. BL8N3]CDY77132.1 hypothetical protein BGLT_06043 [Caballeronia glathei]